MNQTTASDAGNTSGIIAENSTNNNNTTTDTSSVISIDSGFIEPKGSWQYPFDKEEVFNYLCTIHAEEGMRGTVIVTPPSSSS